MTQMDSPQWTDEQQAKDAKPAGGESRPIPAEAVYAGWLGTAVKDLAPTTEADPVAILGTFLGAFSTMIGSGPFVQIHDDRHPLTVWPMILGRTSTGRKGMSLTLAKKLIREADYDFYAQHISSGLSSGEGLIQAVADEDEDEHPGGKRLLVVETEYAVTMARAGRDGNTLGGVLRQAWEGDNLRVMTKAALRATSPHIGIIAHITPNEFRTKVKSADMAGGTYNRFLPLYSERAKEIALGDGATPELIASIALQLAERVKSAQDARKVVLSPDAQDLWTDIVYSALSASPANDGALSQFTARATPYCRRIAALYALAEGGVKVEREHMLAAYELMNYSRATAAFVLGAVSTGDPDVDKALGALMNAGAAGLTRTEFNNIVFKKHMKAARLTDVLDKLSTFPGVVRARRETGGRPVEAWSYSAEKAEEAEKVASPAETSYAAPAEEVRTKGPRPGAPDLSPHDSAPSADKVHAGRTAYSAFSASSAPGDDEIPLPPEPDEPEDFGPDEEFEV